MSTVRRHIEVEASPSVALAAWSHFARWIMTGHQRLACDELACVDAVRAGLVAFEPADGGRTNVIFNVDYDEEHGPSRAVLEQNVARDLVVFKDYVEVAGKHAGRPTQAEKKARAGEKAAHAHEHPQRQSGAEDEPLSNLHYFPL
jgi:hypothetical protein